MFLLRFYQFLLAAIALQVSADSFFFNGTDFVNQVANISSGCATAMQASLDCDPYLTYVMTSNYWGSMHNDTLQTQFCRASCGTDISSYISNVTAACLNDPQPLPGYPSTYWGDSAHAAWTQMCLTDVSTGQYCTVFIENMFVQSANSSTNDVNWPTDPPDDQLCSNCIVSLFQHQQKTPYSNYDENMASEWASIQSKCGLSFPTSVPALQTNVTQPGGFAAPGSAKTGCLSGNTYTVVSGDNCQTICEKQNCATGTLITINDLYMDCTNLIGGASICLPPTCTTYTVQSGDTCLSIANATTTTFQQLVAWNPFLDTYCTNLIAGQSICASPPGGAQSLSTIAGATVTQTAIYATATASRPASVAVGTTLDCGKYYHVQLGDTCQLIVLNSTISLNLFYAINPSLNTNCTNLQLGVDYCVWPTADWNSTASSTIVTAPTTTPSGTTPNCYQYYTIQSGDNCNKVENMFAITMTQLQAWNPSLLSDCSNLALGEAYCVNGASSSTSSPTSTAGTKKARSYMYPRAHLVSEIQPQRTSAPVEGGVPRGWPGLGAVRLQKGAGYGHQEL